MPIEAGQKRAVVFLRRRMAASAFSAYRAAGLRGAMRQREKTRDRLTEGGLLPAHPVRVA